MSALDVMRGLTEPVWDRPTNERQLPKLGRGRPSKEIERERLRLLQLGYLSPGTKSSPTSRAIQKAIHDQERKEDAENQKGEGGSVEFDGPVETGSSVEVPADTAAAPKTLSPRERTKLLRYAEQMQTTIDRMEAAGAWHSVAYQTAKRDEWLRLANG